MSPIPSPDNHLLVGLAVILGLLYAYYDMAFESQSKGFAFSAPFLSYLFVVCLASIIASFTIAREVLNYGDRLGIPLYVVLPMTSLVGTLLAVGVLQTFSLKIGPTLELPVSQLVVRLRAEVSRQIIARKSRVEHQTQEAVAEMLAVVASTEELEQRFKEVVGKTPQDPTSAAALAANAKMEEYRTNTGKRFGYHLAYRLAAEDLDASIQLLRDAYSNQKRWGALVVKGYFKAGFLKRRI